MNTSVIVLTVVGVVQLIAGLYVLIKRKADLESGLFLIGTIAFAVWNLAMAALLGHLTTDKALNIIFDRATYFAAPVILIFLILYFLKLKTDDLWTQFKKNKFLIFLTVFAIINLILIPTNLISNNPGLDHMIVGPLMSVLGAFSLLGAIYILYLCIQGYKSSEGQVKQQFFYSIVGFITFVVIALVFNVLLPILGYSSYPMIGAASTVFIVIFMGLGAVESYIATGITSVLGIILGILAAAMAAIGGLVLLVRLIFKG